MTPRLWIAIGAFIGLTIVALMLYAATAQAHDFYSGKHNPENNNSCCNGSDCKVITDDQWSITTDGFTVKWSDGQTYSLPLDQVLPTEDKEGRAAACVWGGRLRCGFIPLSY